MRTARRLVTVMGGVVPTYEDVMQSYVDAGTLPLWLKFTETSGTTADNAGSLGAAGDGTSANLTVGATGAFGAAEAYDFDNAANVVSIANHTSINALAAFTYGFLVKPDTIGGSYAGRIFEWSDSPGARTYFLFNSITKLQVRRLFSTTVAASDAVFSSTLMSEWAYLFAVLSGTKLYLYRYRLDAGVFEEGSYSLQTPAEGTLITETASLRIGNRGGDFARGFDGLMDEFWLATVAMTTDEMEEIGRLAAVRKSGV